MGSFKIGMRHDAFDMSAIEWTGNNLDEINEFLKDRMVKAEVLTDGSLALYRVIATDRYIMGNIEGTGSHGNLVVKAPKWESIVGQDYFDQYYVKI